MCRHTKVYIIPFSGTRKDKICLNCARKLIHKKNSRLYILDRRMKRHKKLSYRWKIKDLKKQGWKKVK